MTYLESGKHMCWGRVCGGWEGVEEGAAARARGAVPRVGPAPVGSRLLLLQQVNSVIMGYPWVNIPFYIPSSTTNVKRYIKMYIRLLSQIFAVFFLRFFSYLLFYCYIHLFKSIFRHLQKKNINLSAYIPNKINLYFIFK